MKDVGVEDAASEDRSGIAEHGLHVPAEDPHVQERIARARWRAEERGGMGCQRPCRHGGRREVDEQRCKKGPGLVPRTSETRPGFASHVCASSRFSSSLASFGLAFPPLPFITWPTRYPNV